VTIRFFYHMLSPQTLFVLKTQPQEGECDWDNDHKAVYEGVGGKVTDSRPLGRESSINTMAQFIAPLPIT